MRQLRITAYLFMATLVLAAAPARSGEEEDFARVLRRYEQVNSELQRALRDIDSPRPVPDYPDRLLSIERNASVTIGGELRTNYIGSRGNFVDPGPPPAGFGIDAPSGAPAKSRTTDLQVSDARLAIDARIRYRWRARLEMNLNGYEGFHRVFRTRNPNDPAAGPPYTADYPNLDWPYYVGEASLEMLKAGHSGFGFKVGAFKPSFGLQTRPDLVGRSYLDGPDLVDSYLMDPLAYRNGVRLPHAARFRDPVLAAMANYEMRDIVRFEAGVFQELCDYPRGYAVAGGRYKYRNDSPPPRSWQVGLSLLPLEGWELSATFRNRYSRSRGIHYWADSPYRWDFRSNGASGGGDPAWDDATAQWVDGGAGPAFGSRKNEQSFIVGLAVEIPNTKLAVQLEYAHGWNQGFNKYLNSDDVNLGLSYRLTPLLTLFGQAEWLHLKDRSWMAQTAGGTWARDSRNNRLYRFLLGAQYELFSGMTVEAGWQYEYWNITSSLGGAGGTKDERVSQANMYYLGTRFVF